MVARAGPKKGKGRTGVSGLLDNAALADWRRPRGQPKPAGGWTRRPEKRKTGARPISLARRQFRRRTRPQSPLLGFGGHHSHGRISAFGGKANITQCLLLRSLLGVKRTWRFALQMSAFDPKRTFRRQPTALILFVSRQTYRSTYPLNRRIV